MSSIKCANILMMFMLKYLIALIWGFVSSNTSWGSIGTKICVCYHMPLIMDCTYMGLIRMQRLEHYRTSLPTTFQGLLKER